MVNGTSQLKLTQTVQFLVRAYPIEIERRRQLHGNHGYSLGPDSQLDPGEEILLTTHSCCRTTVLAIETRVTQCNLVPKSSSVAFLKDSCMQKTDSIIPTHLCHVYNTQITI